MSFDSVPSKAEVMSWNPPQLADFLRKMDLGGCDKVITKCGMNGRRFLSMTDNDFQKFPKLHAPLISKICKDINKKEEKRGFFPKRTVHKYPEPVAVPEDVGWDSEEFDHSEDDYESPNSGGGGGSGSDYESPTEEDPKGPPEGGDSDNDYEPPPSEPPDELPRQICPAKPLGDSDYIDNTQSRGVSVKVPNQPPIPPQRPGPGPPQVNHRPTTLPAPPRSRREESPKRPFRPPNKPVPGPNAPPVDRTGKPTALERGLPCLPTPPEKQSPLPERKHFGPGERTTPPRRPPAVEKHPEIPRLAKPPIPGLPGTGVGRRVSSVSQQTATSRPFSQDHRNYVPEEATPAFPAGGSNSFPLSARNLGPRPGLPSATFDSLPHNHPATLSLPLPPRLQPGVTVQRSSSRAQADRGPKLPLPPPQLPLPPPQRPEPQPESEQGLNPRWYVGQATRSDAENNLRRINQDGTFLVRDSSRGSSTQPYTLMVLYQGKVYNIQIRYNSDEDAFLLGTGFKSRENFPRVDDIIKYHMQTALLLIDAKDRGSGQQRQCLLTHPAGY